LAKAPKRRLKVFQAQFGFHDSVVAAPSQAAALRAWGTHQNLFADGQARLTDDDDAIKAALEHPEIPLRRAVGSSDKFALEPTSLPKIPDAPKSTHVAKAKPDAKPPAPVKPQPDRKDLDAAEAALKALDEGRKREEADFREQQAALEAARDTAQAAYVADRKSATAKMVQARRAYRKAGGAD
jgi:type IV secretory pathway VirB10-like protein